MYKHSTVTGGIVQEYNHNYPITVLGGSAERTSGSTVVY